VVLYGLPGNDRVATSMQSVKAPAPVRAGKAPQRLERGAANTQNNTKKKDYPAVAILIDDAGEDVAHTREAIALPSGVTLSFLPYADQTPALSKAASAAGHEVMVHLPMEPIGAEDPGPMALYTNQTPEEVTRRVVWALSRVADSDGVNNHMGSRFTASRAALEPVMKELAAHKLFFLDSRTTAATEGEAAARDEGLLTGRRNIFIDDKLDQASIAGQIAAMETFAHQHGSVIAIGHPHATTLAALQDWTKNAEARGFKLVTVREALQMQGKNVSAQRSPSSSSDGG
jgi:polysaccharide deacetylase 2 family uncharacterized protein YibQ